MFTEEKTEADGKKFTQLLYLQKHRLGNGEHTLVLTVEGNVTDRQ